MQDSNPYMQLSKAAAECCEEARRRFALEIGQYPVDHLVMADESAVNVLTTYRENGWAYTGVRARKRCNFVWGIRCAIPCVPLYAVCSLPRMNDRYSLLPAITVDGIIYSDVKVGGYNGEQFLVWLEGLLKEMNPYPAPRSVLILDNCRIHHVPGVEEMCKER